MVEVRGVNRNVYVALVHHPIKGAHGEIITTSVTNIDVHDIARSARTYGVARYYVVTPIRAQHEIMKRIIEHWAEGDGLRRIPTRIGALERCAASVSLEEAVSDIAAREGEAPQVMVTQASRGSRVAIPFGDAAEKLRERPTLIVFGTGRGLADEIISSADWLIEPIVGAPGSDYNHLSVRAAAAIVLDRLLS